MLPDERQPPARPSAEQLVSAPRGAVLCVALLEERFPAASHELLTGGRAGAAAAVSDRASSAIVRVFEVTGPDAWIDLVERYPVEVTAERRDSWRAVTGVDRRWFIPDWAAAAAEWDAVHVSVDGWLTCATRLLDLGSGRSSVLAGWDPDQTWWLTDCLRPVGEPVDWFNDQSLAGTGFNWQPRSTAEDSTRGSAP